MLAAVPGTKERSVSKPSDLKELTHKCVGDRK